MLALRIILAWTLLSFLLSACWVLAVKRGDSKEDLNAALSLSGADS